MSNPKEIFESHIAGRLADPEHAEKAKEIDAIYQFHVSGDEGGDWIVDLRACEVKTGSTEDADCTIAVADSDFVDLVEGRVPGPQLFMSGKLRVSGNMGLAMKLGEVLGAG